MSGFRIMATALGLLLSAQATQAQEAGPGCWVRGERADLELRASPFDSAAIDLQSGTVKVCYSRPRKLGRPIMGRLVPYGEPWRMGANEATAVHVPGPATIAGVELAEGWYSLYAVPGEQQWRIVVNADADRWGIPIDDDVRARDIGSVVVPAERVDTAAELLGMEFRRRTDDSADLIVHWDHTVIHVPVVLGSTPHLEE